jgi:monoterpene epsilon-lactone hydrolase
MASWQAYVLTWVLKIQIKRKLRTQSDIGQVRAAMERVKHPIPKTVDAEPRTLGGIAGEWLTPAQSVPRGTLLYLHGGGYFACSPQTHRPITTGLAGRGLQVFVPHYRLAPEHPFPAAIEDAVAAYRGMLATGIPAEDITIAGDSAGGGLTMATLLSLRDAGDPLPAAALLFSPWTDLAATGASLVTNDKRDAMFNGDGIARGAEPYLAGTDPRNPLASPIYANLHGLPPILIHAGSYEVLLDDSTRLAERIGAAGGTVTMRTWPVVPHVWQLFRFVPEARESLDEAAAFLLKAGPATGRLAACSARGRPANRHPTDPSVEFDPADPA